MTFAVPAAFTTLIQIALTAAFAQSVPQAEPPAAQGSAAVTPAQEAAEILASGRFAAPLIPEGGHFRRAQGRLGRDEFLGVWTFDLSDRVNGAANRSIILLPSQALDDMVSTHQERAAQGAESPTFELSGAIFVFRGANFLLPSFANPVSHSTASPPLAPTQAPAPAPGSESATSLAPPSAAAPLQAAESTAPIDPETFAAELERRLQSRIESVPTSAAPVVDEASAPPNPDPPAASMPMIEPVPIVVVGQPHLDRAAELLPPMRIQSRRGTVTRDPITGTWRFIFASGHRDEGDVAMELLPCTTLTALITQARSSTRTPILLTGDVEVFEGRNYLRPIRFKALSAGKGIGP
ncbi:MAG: hypothetical protein EXS03_03580 [Phycisphaerales bacterium]|nr:hypothetical protein [Phycisphaerales bacterium]